MTPPAHIPLRNAGAVPTASDYQIGPVRVRLTTALPEVAATYHELYGQFKQRTASREEGFEVQVIRRRSRRTGLAHIHIRSDVDESFTVRRMSRVLPHVEASVNLCIARMLPRYLLLHAAALTRSGMGVVLPGGPGFGKTTLAAALIARGWQYASDEFAMIDGHHGTLVPYPKAMSIKSGSIETLRRTGVAVDAAPVFDRADKGAIRLLPADVIRADAIAQASQVRLLVFPCYEPGARTVATPLSRAEAVFEMSRRCFNLLRYRSRAIDILAAIARGAHSYRLRSGDLDASCRWMERLANDARANFGAQRRPIEIQTAA